jgi:uncharacterized damage-inducible protein DinB
MVRKSPAILAYNPDAGKVPLRRIKFKPVDFFGSQSFMPTSNPLDILLRHDQWATRQILLACEKLTIDQFHQRFPMGPGSLHDTTTHIMGAMRAWNDTLAGRPRQPRLEGTKRTVGELLAILDEQCMELSRAAAAFPLDHTATISREGKEYVFSRGEILTHVTTHGMHHRAQCLNMLRQLGVSPLPLSSVIEWVRTIDSPAV